MGTKDRVFTALPPLTLEDLVPPDHFYRHLEQSLDLSFVRALVHDAYAETGRPSIDPMVFFKLQLVLFLEGLRSERQVLRVAADRLSLRWYLGYDLTESHPDHSCLTRIRERYGLKVFRRFFLVLHHLLGHAVYVTEDRAWAAKQVVQHHLYGRDADGLTHEQVLSSPDYLLGTVDQICEQLVAQRERHGISRVTVYQNDLDAFAPVVARLAGQ